MAESSAAASNRFSRARLAVGVLLVAIVAAGVAFGFGSLSGGAELGRVVYASERGVFVRDLASGSTRRVTGLPADTLDAWPDDQGRWLGYLRRRGDLWLLDLERKTRWQVSERFSVGLGWTPDRRFLAGEVASDRDLVAVDPEDRGSHLVVGGYSGGRPVWRNRDQFLAAVGGGDLVVVRLSGSTPRVRKVLDRAWPLAVSPDGAELLYVREPQSPNARVFIGRLEGSKVVGSRMIFRGTAHRAGVSRQGHLAFSGFDRNSRRGTWVVESPSREARRVSSIEAESIGWSLDGKTLIYVADGLFAVDLRDHRRVRLSSRGDYVRAFNVVP